MLHSDPGAGCTPDDPTRNACQWYVPRRRRFTGLVRFGVAGVIATGVHVATATSLIYLLNASQVEANGVAFAIANVSSYFLNTLWSFSQTPRRDNFLRFFCVSILGLGMTLGISWLAERLGTTYWQGLVCVLAAVPPLTYVLHRVWTYRPLTSRAHH
ncbi:GtrA family protein [Cupriavidus pinatubonensis]|uniref:GtrA family protein n=1 Tax=Cupriavidus pinatubonensis TaxID=248026 RepID=UPI001C736275|nr:GtrA family protein [Cupriavidus pinatubonensis]QYY30840.1 GtrA family protein [Cupriavidus pinatubonensis]